MSNPGAPGSEAEVEELEQAFEEMDQDFEKLVLKRKAATVSIAAKARALIAHAKQESEDIINEAKAEAEIILAGAAEESKKLRAEQVALVQDAKKQAESILAGAVDEINRLEAEKTAFAGLQQPDATVMLNIGSTRFETSLTTLCRFPNSMIGCMFSGRHALPLGKDEHFFIDRDGTHFRHILNFLRSPEGYQVSRGADARELRRECEYYGIDQLMFPDHPLAKPQQQPQPQFYFQPQYQHMPQAQAQASSSISRLTSAGTEKSFAYFELRGHKVGTIAVRIDLAGVHTIRDSGEPIKMCRHCDRAIFAIGARKYFFRSLYMQSTIVAAQPKVQGICPGCDMLC
eukprot:CAMPEP_0173176716 /NCGR_PEP_ID=MMETSP1141-20130122/4614_1 /TAXON_ID=483371 /ORGANISM="non described non described, Strain CCMP2298" /LENGTH=343 /DNA_ID=CAMNT_0014099085 /DNA_START=687 /DNA_END=1718 /DNA_ORIENTATION=+